MLKLLEKDIEKRFCQRVRRIGGIPYKFKSPNRRSVPDRLCLFNVTFAIFVELKAPGKTSTPKQLKEQARIREKGFLVFQDVDTYEKVDDFIEFVKLAM